MPLEPGTALRPYQVTAKIGEGGIERGVSSERHDQSPSPLTHLGASVRLLASVSQTPDRNKNGNRDPWDLKADHLRSDVAKLREEVERLLEVEELRAFVYRMRQNRALRRLRPHKPPSVARSKARVAADKLATEPASCT